MSIKFGRRLALASLSLGLLSMAAHADGDPFLGAYAYWQGNIEFDGPYYGGAQYNVSEPPTTTFVNGPPPLGTSITHFAFASDIVNPNYDPLNPYSSPTTIGYLPNGSGGAGGSAWIQGGSTSSGGSSGSGSFSTTGSPSAPKFRCYFTWINPNRPPTLFETPNSINVGPAFSVGASLGIAPPGGSGTAGAGAGLSFWKGALIYMKSMTTFSSGGTPYVSNFSTPFTPTYVPALSAGTTRINGPWMSLGCGSSVSTSGSAVGVGSSLVSVTFQLTPNLPNAGGGQGGPGGGGPGGGGPLGGGGGQGGGSGPGSGLGG
jgi:hypothetical protein